jgi:site-specific recombinase XerD
MLDELEASGQFAETYFSALTNNNITKQKPTPTKPTNQERLTKQMQRLQEKRRLQGDEIEELDNEQTEATRRRFSFAYITLQVLLSPFRTFYYYLMATLTQSQERYQRVTQHKKRTRHMRLVESWMGFINEACLVENRPVLQWAWQMMAMFFWPLVRVFGGGLLIDK